MSGPRVLVVASDTVREAVASELDGTVPDLSVVTAQLGEHTETDGVDCVVVAAGEEGLAVADAVDSSLPVFLFPAAGSEQLAGEAMAAGVTGYVSRQRDDPYAVLVDRIRQAVTGEGDTHTRDVAELEEAVETILENVPLVFFAFDEDGVFTRSQGRSLDKLGLEPGEAVGESVFDLFADNPTILDHCERALSGEQVTATVELGTTVFETWYHPLREGGDVVGVVGHAYDITERTAREQDLRRKTRAIESAPIGIVMTDPNQPDNPILYANDRFVEMTGYSRDEAYGRNCRFLQGERTAAESVRQLREAVAAREPTTVELRNYRADGTEFWNRVSLSPVFDDSGELVNFVGFQQDVTRQRRRGRQMQVFNRILRHNLRNRLMVARARVGDLAQYADDDTADEALSALGDVYSLGENGRKLTRAMTLTDRSREVEMTSYLSELVSQFELEYPDASVTVEESDEAVLTVFPNLELAVHELLENAVVHGGVQPRVILGVEADTESVRIHVRDTGPGLSHQERAILVDGSEAPLIHGSGLGLWMVYWTVQSNSGSIDVSVDESGTTVTVTLPRSNGERTVPTETVSQRELQQARDRFQTIFDEVFSGLIIVDDQGRYIEGNQAATDLFGRSDRALLGRSLDEFVVDTNFERVVRDARTDDRERVEMRLDSGDGDERIVECSVSPGITPGQHLVALHDVTVREHRNERLDQFASAVSHDLRNPLNVATKQLELAREDRDSEHLEHVERAHRRMDELITDVLSLARAGRAVGEPEYFDLGDTVIACWTNVDADQATLTVETDGLVYADHNRFRQLVANLLRNAVEHGPAGSQTHSDSAVEHDTRVSIAVGTLEDEDGIYVADDGAGIPAEKRDTVFESGFSTREDGTGFGLAIVRDIAQAHDWRIRVTESADGGARFEITGMEITPTGGD